MNVDQRLGCVCGANTQYRTILKIGISPLPLQFVYKKQCCEYDVYNYILRLEFESVNKHIYS